MTGALAATLQELSTLHGVSGFEQPLVAAHLDEIGFNVGAVGERGFPPA